MTNQLVVSEYFGPTPQGEGRSVGRRAVFLRLGGCNLYCSWCDSCYTWKFSDAHPTDDPKVYDPRVELHKMSIDDVTRSLIEKGLDGRTILVITGGEPLLQRGGIVELLTNLNHIEWNGHVEIETNGTRLPLERVSLSPPIDRPVMYNISPKLDNSKVKMSDRVVPWVLDSWVALATASSRPVAVKFVCQSPYDLDEVQVFLRRFPFPHDCVYIMPEGRSREDVNTHTVSLAEEVIQLGYNITPRLHIAIWGNKRAV